MDLLVSISAFIGAAACFAFFVVYLAFTAIDVTQKIFGNNDNHYQ